MDLPNYVDIVRVVKAELIAHGLNVDQDETTRAEITFRVADRIHWRTDPNVGLLYKDTGNQVRERAVDILCFRDGTIVDILGAGPEGPNTPLWMVNSLKVDPERWRAPFLYHVELPPPEPDPIPDLPPIVVPNKPPIPMPVPVPPAPAPVPSGLANALSALGAWLGTQAVTALLGWWSKRKVMPTSKPSNPSTAIPRPIPPSRSTLPK